MAGWAGFTDEDLMQIKGTPKGSSKPSASLRQQALLAKKQKLQQQRVLAQQRAQEFSQEGDSGVPALQPSQRLSHPLPSSPRVTEQTGGELGEGKDSRMVTAGEQLPAETKSTSGGDNDGAIVKEKETDQDVKELDEQEGLSKELSKIELFRQQQQKMEKENKERRKLLADAIKQRSKMAKEEAEKLTKVQKELNHLDSLVTADVSVIRDRIEAASIDFLQAQKRYERAEHEFVLAKMALAEKSELKESLTEHLYTIIQQNEARKAERLATLMKQLGLGGEGLPAPIAVPPLLSFSPINTLHRPQVIHPPDGSHPPETNIHTHPCNPTDRPQSEGSLEHPQALPSAGVDRLDHGPAGSHGVEQTPSQSHQAESSTPIQATDSQQTTPADKEGVIEGKAAHSAGVVTANSLEAEKTLHSSCSEEVAQVGEGKEQREAGMENGSRESQDGGADASVVLS